MSEKNRPVPGKDVFPFQKARRRIVEELAIQRVIADISEEGGVPIPPSWMKEVEMISREIVGAVGVWAEKEGVKME